MKLHAPLLMLGLMACQPDETVSRHTDGVTAFALQSIDGTAFKGSATIDISESGKIAGRAPCNSYFASQTAPYPWFALGPIGSTKMACPDLAQEGQFFDALGAMTLVEVVGNTLILSNDTGREMVFQAP
ncbi:MAG: META domain-containing protein [Yoonia sp.]